jgi:hypothetical protein
MKSFVCGKVVLRVQRATTNVLTARCFDEICCVPKKKKQHQPIKTARDHINPEGTAP